MNIKSSDEHMVPIEDLVNPRAIDYHAELGHIYFADTTSFLIGRQKIDGSNRETILKDGELNAFLIVPAETPYNQWSWVYAISYISESSLTIRYV